MADVSIQLHACLNAMKNLSREKKDVVAKSKKEIADLRKEAISRGMVTLQQDGIIKVLEGITTIEEVERVVGTLR